MYNRFKSDQPEVQLYLNKLWYWSKVVPDAVASIIIAGMILQFAFLEFTNGVAMIILFVALTSISFFLHWFIGRALFKKYYLRLKTPFERYEFLKRSQRWNLARLYDIGTFIALPHYSPKPEYNKAFEELEPEKIPFTIHFYLDHLVHQQKRYEYDNITDLEIQRVRYSNYADLVLKNGEKVRMQLSSKEIIPTEYLFFKFIENHRSKSNE